MVNPEKGGVQQVKLKRKHAIWIAFWIFVIHLVAIAQFSSGFLLTRPVLPNHSSKPSIEQPPFEKLVILVVDALRYDFVETPKNSPDLPYLRQIPLSSIEEDPRRSFTLKFIADPPTTTLQRLKGLTTGSLPAFIDAGSNFAGSAIEEDNWVYQAATTLGPVAFVGDDTWEALFSNVLTEILPFPSLNVRDLDTVDNGVKNNMKRMILNDSNSVVIGHMLGVDHVGHRYGPNHPSMSTKLQETYAFVKEVASVINDKTVLMVFGDHGMDQTGNHGGDSPDELEAALWVYSKKPKFNSQGPKTVNQIDLVPTISGLLGLPIPFNSLGFPIRQAFGSSEDWKKISKLAGQQLEEYSEAVGMTVDPNIGVNLHSDPEQFQMQMLQIFKVAWAQFDIYAMQRGIGLLLASIGLCIAFYNSLDVALIEKISVYQSIGALVGTLIGVILNIYEFKESLLRFVISTSFWSASGALAMGFIISIPSIKTSLPSPFSVLALLLLALEMAGSFSNSFVIWESKTLQFLLATTVIILGVSSSRKGSPLVLYLGGWYTGALLLTMRLSSSWVLCREETAARCATTVFESGSSLVPTWSLFLLSLFALVLPRILSRFWKIGQNYVGISLVVLNITSLALAVVIGYWSLDNAEARGWISREAFGLQTGKLILGRLGLCVGVLGGFSIWWRANVPIEIVLSKYGNPKKIEGYRNVFGAHNMLIAVCLFWTLAVTNKPPAVLALIGLLFSSLAILDLLDVTDAKYTLLTPVLFDMLGNGFFYFTGHQATIPSIQWDIAFVAARSVSYPWSPLTVTLNTLGPVILCSLVCVFSALWRRSPFKDPVQPLAIMMSTFAGYAFVTAVRTVASVIAAFILRRHLMTWKIFAPRFMFGAIILLVCDITCIFGIVLSSHTIKQVAELFG